MGYGRAAYLGWRSQLSFVDCAKVSFETEIIELFRSSILIKKIVFSDHNHGLVSLNLV